MRPLFFLAAALAATAATVSAIDINGWYPCGPTNRPRRDDGLDKLPETVIPVTDKVAFECAQVPMSLCYDGLCKGDRGELVHVFVKRIAAKPSAAQSGQPAKSMWFVTGGPGSTSAGLEGRMNNMYKHLNGSVSVYTFDHRGTGRSNYLNCEAAQVDVDGSEFGKFLTLEETNACHKDLNFRYKNKGAAFSITSAAMDLKNLIEGLNSKEDVYVQGLSYGSSLLQRFVQLKPPSQVKGYLFDGVNLNPTESSKIPSQWVNSNEYTLPPTRRLFEACFDDASCPLKFKSRETVVEEVLTIIESLDTSVETNLCAQYLATWGVYAKPSDSLRGLLAHQPASIKSRGYVPFIFSKLKTCTEEEIAVIGPLIDPSYQYNIEIPMGVAGNNTIARRRLQEARATQQPSYVDPLRSLNKNVYSTIVASELFGPIPSLDKLSAAYKPNPFSRPSAIVAELSPAYQDPSLSYLSYDFLESYCWITGHDEDVCKRVREEVQMEAPLSYNLDKYAAEPLVLGDQASALILNGGLDFQTPAELGEELLALLQGGRGKLSVTFGYGGHCIGEAVESFLAMPCRISIIKQFVMFNGDVAKIDRSCLKQQPKPSFPATYP